MELEFSQHIFEKTIKYQI